MKKRYRLSFVDGICYYYDGQNYLGAYFFKSNLLSTCCKAFLKANATEV